MDEFEEFMASLKEYMDERLVKPLQKCGECNKNLEFHMGDILFYNKTSKKWLCYDCYSTILLNEDIIYFQFREDGMAEMIRTRSLPAGPDVVEKYVLDISTLINENSDTCEHIENDFDKFNLIFHCEDCKKWICASCISKHKRHSITGNPIIENGEKIIQILPYQYEPIIRSKDLKINLKLPKKVYIGKKFPLHLEIENNGSEAVYDLDVYFGLHSSITNPSSEYDNYEIGKIARIESIKPSSIKKLDLNIGLRNLDTNLPIETIIKVFIYCKDFFDGSISKDSEYPLIIEKEMNRI